MQSHAQRSHALFRAPAIESTRTNNTVKFHPGMHGGMLRVEGGGGFFNQSIGFTPKSWTDSGHRFHKLEVTAGADGDNEVRIAHGIRAVSAQTGPSPSTRLSAMPQRWIADARAPSSP